MATQYDFDSIIIEEAKTRFAVTDGQLNQEINQPQILEIARHIGETTSYELAFDLEEHEKQQIKIVKSMKGYIESTIEMLQFWKVKVGRRATYRNLLEVVYVNAKNVELGEKILKYILRKSIR